MYDDLTNLAIKYGTDKFGKHSYTPYYYELLKKRRKSIKKVLEIGVGQGASLRMWRDFFPDAEIYGAEIDPKRVFKEKKITVIKCDQSSKKDLINLISVIGTDIDLIVEDASHIPEDQISTCMTLMPLLKKGAIYVIEDVADPSIVDKLGEYNATIPAISQPRRRYDNRLVVVKHIQTNISFFAKSPSRVGPDRHLARVSSIIRGNQIAEYIGAKINPTNGYQNDVCIYVKPPYTHGHDFTFEGKAYLDIVDSDSFYDLLRKHPEVGVISLSDWNYKILRKLLPNEIINIPQQHCNFDRVKRNRKKIKTVGMIGTYKAFDFLPKGIKEELAKRNIELLEFSKFRTRQDIVDFYMKIDIQIVWRPYYNYKKDILANPLKIVNASSFGIPTIAYDEKTFKEMNGCYIPVHTLEEFLAELDKLKSNSDFYNKYIKKCLEKSEKYHIENIAQLYKNLAL